MVNPPVKTLTHGANAAFNWRNGIVEDQNAGSACAVLKKEPKTGYGSAQYSDSSRRLTEGGKYPP